MLEVALEFPEKTRGLALNLWYGNFPARKRLKILSGEETAAVGPGSISRYFVPADAECPVYGASDLALPGFKDFPPGCVAASQSWSCGNGRWATLDPLCAFDYSKASLDLTAEYCSAQVNASVSVSAIRYYPDLTKCWCAGGSSCADDWTCDVSAKLPAPWCGAGTPRCAGLCLESAATEP